MTKDKPVETSERPMRRRLASTAPRKEMEFARRLGNLCDAHPDVPALHSGRLSWLANQLKQRFGEEVSVESVRKWLAGETRPREAKMAHLAELLDADVAYLALGHDPEITPRDRARRNVMAEGVVNVVAGLIQIDGGSVAFADDEPGGVDFTAIIRGGRYDIRVLLGVEVDGRLKFAAPVNENVITLGVLRREDSVCFEIFDIAPEAFLNGQKRGTATEILVERNDAHLRPVTSFRQRL